MEEEQRGDGVDPAPILLHEAPGGAGGEYGEEDIERENVARADVESRAHGHEQVKDWWDGEEEDLARATQSASGDGEDGEQQQPKKAERRFDGEGYGEVVPDAVREHAAKDVAGHEVGELPHIGQAVEVRLGQDVVMGEDGKDAEFMGPQGLHEICQRWIEHETVGPRGVAKTVEGPKHDDGEHGDGGECSGETESEFRARDRLGCENQFAARPA